MTDPLLELSSVVKDYRGLRPLRIEHARLNAGEQLALLGVDEPWEASLTNHQSELVKKVRKIGRELAA